MMYGIRACVIHAARTASQLTDIITSAVKLYFTYGGRCSYHHCCTIHIMSTDEGLNGINMQCNEYLAGANVLELCGLPNNYASFL